MIVILGCGPAGLLAAHAAALDGKEFVVYSKEKEKSVLSGAQYLHARIPHITGSPALPAFEIEYRKVGTRSGYAKKVYGDENADCSWALFPKGRVIAWSMSDLYETLWERYSGAIREATIGPPEVREILRTGATVLSSIPRPSLCSQGCEFRSATVRYVDESPLPGPANVILYSGRPEDRFYRTSIIRGFESTEFERGALAPELADRTGRKPTGHSCGCRTEPNFFPIGRFGKWKKGVLVHDAFEDARRVIR